MVDEPIPLRRRPPHLSQDQAAEQTLAKATVACPDCGAAIGYPCTRPSILGPVVTVLVHPRRVTAARQLRTENHAQPEEE